MGWYLRKAFKVGPMRINLSKSGLGASFGITGARIGLGPRGAYVAGGRHGLYFKQSLSGKGPSSRPSPGPRASADVNQSPKITFSVRGKVIERDPNAQASLRRRDSADVTPPSETFFSEKALANAVYSNDQISQKAYSLDFSLNKVRVMKPLLIGVLLAWLGNGFLSGGALKTGGVLLVTGIGMLILLFVRIVRQWIKKTKAKKLLSALQTTVSTDNLGRKSYDIDKAVLIMSRTTTQGAERAFAVINFLQECALNAIKDFQVTEAEGKELGVLQRALGVNDAGGKKIKLWGFNQIYLNAVEDHALSGEEESNINATRNALELDAEDVKDEMATLDMLREIRLIEKEDLRPIAADLLYLKKEEVCYHKTVGRILKEKTVRAYQAQGIRTVEKGLVVETEGDLYLTSGRMIILGEGGYSLDLGKILNMETDLDENKIRLLVAGKKSPVVISCPDSLVTSAKLNKLLKKRSA